MRNAFSFFAILIVLIFLLSGCGKKKDEKAAASDVPEDLDRQIGEIIKGLDKEEEKKVPDTPEKRVFKKDLREILASKSLRVLMTRESVLRNLPVNITPEAYEYALLSNLARRLKLDLVIVYMDKFEDLIPALLDGRGDIIAANITVTEKRKKEITFTLPIASVTEQVVANSKNTAVKKLSDLVCKNIIIEKGTCYRESLETLAAKIPSIRVLDAPDGIDTEELLKRVGSRKIELTVADSNYIDAFHGYSSSIKTVYEFPEKRDIAWAVRPNSNSLLKLLNSFLKSELPQYKRKSFKGDLPEIKKLGILRVLTRNNPSSYFIHRGVLMGFEYEVVKEFAKRNGLQPVMIVPPRWNDLVPWLLEGKGDIIAASMAVTEKRKDIKGISFSLPYLDVSKKIVARKKDNAVNGLKDLKGRTIVVRKNSSYWETLEKLRDGGIGFRLIAAPDEFETYEIIQSVSDGKYDLTVADDNILNAELLHNPGIKATFNIGAPDKYSWVVREEDTQLKQAVDDFFRKEYKKEFLNVLYNKYFKSVKTAVETRPVFSGKGVFSVSPFDSLIKRYSNIYDFHWCLVASQIYQESQFNPNIKAWDGGMGLMQLMPATASMMGCRNVFAPDDNIQAGLKYMSSIRKKLDVDIAHKDKLCFTLASYNGGYGHLLDARRLAIEMELDPDKWYGNVEKALSLLTKPEYSSKARYGYCASPIVINYVNNIMLRYFQYLEELERLQKK